MKRLFLVVPLILYAAFSYAQEGVGVLFDNSGSMRQYCSPEMLRQAQEAVIDLVLKGNFDANFWNKEAESDHFKNRSNPELWQPGNLIYVHAFGELNSRTAPFFKSKPDFAELKTVAEAEQFMRTKLFDQLNFDERRTNIELAKLLCWWSISNQLGASGRAFFMNVLVISDFEPDVNKEYAGVDGPLKNHFTNNNADEPRLLRLVHKTTSTTNPNVKLQIELFRIGPHFIPPPSPVPSAGGSSSGSPRSGARAGDEITLKLPHRNEKLNEKEKPRVTFTWEAKGSFEKYILEIYSEKPLRNLVTRGLEEKSITIPTKDLIARMDKAKAERIFWSVRGIYPENDSGFISVPSEKRPLLKDSQAGSGFPWWLLLLALLAVAGIVAAPKIKQWINEKRKAARGEKTTATSSHARTTEAKDDDW